MTTSNFNSKIVKSMEQSMNNIQTVASHKAEIERLQKKYTEIDKEFKRNYFVFSESERAKTVAELKSIDSQICDLKRLVTEANKKQFDVKPSGKDFHKNTSVQFGYMSIRRDKNMN